LPLKLTGKPELAVAFRDSVLPNGILGGSAWNVMVWVAPTHTLKLRVTGGAGA
jgi:hypothetical protein